MFLHQSVRLRFFCSGVLASGDIIRHRRGWSNALYLRCPYHERSEKEGVSLCSLGPFISCHRVRLIAPLSTMSWSRVLTIPGARAAFKANWSQRWSGDSSGGHRPAPPTEAPPAPALREESRSRSGRIRRRQRWSSASRWWLR